MKFKKLNILLLQIDIIYGKFVKIVQKDTEQSRDLVGILGQNFSQPLLILSSRSIAVPIQLEERSSGRAEWNVLFIVAFLAASAFAPLNLTENQGGKLVLSPHSRRRSSNDFLLSRRRGTSYRETNSD